MEPVFERGAARLYQGDTLEVLRGMEDGSVNCVVTSPPYWGLRDYGVDGQMGLEPTVEEYVERITQVFREVRRVLAPDGTCWVNMGDCYDSGTRATRCPSEMAEKHGYWTNPLIDQRTQAGLGAKQLVGLPWRVAFALQADGWYLRSDIIWHKPNPMPESVTDRPTRAHEYLFLLTKSARYWYDAVAIKEPASADTHARYARGRSDNHKWADGGPGNQTIAKTLEHMARKNGEERTERTTGTARTNGEGVNPKCYKGSSFTKGKTGAVHANVGQGPRRSYVKQNPSFSAAVKDVVEMRNARTVWKIATQPYSGAHFATFPEALVRPCVLAGCPAGGVVLDPFCGTSTTGVVALRHRRRYVGIELNPKSIELSAQRLAPVIEETALIDGAWGE